MIRARRRQGQVEARGAPHASGTARSCSRENLFVG